MELVVEVGTDLLHRFHVERWLCHEQVIHISAGVIDTNPSKVRGHAIKEVTEAWFAILDS